jgi:hypothetical protein
VTSSAPECGPGCDSPTITRLDCGATSLCGSATSVPQGAACLGLCQTSADCGASAYCGVAPGGGGLTACLPALGRGVACAAEGGGARCGAGLLCASTAASSGTSCVQSCTTTSDCYAGEYCGAVTEITGESSGCVPALLLGAPCSTEPGAQQCDRGLSCLPSGGAMPEAGGADASSADAGGEASGGDAGGGCTCELAAAP